MFRLVRLAITIAVLAGIWYLAVPKLASHFGWATRWPSTMPTTLKFRGREYGSPTRCRGRSATPLRARPGADVGSVPVLLGSSLPILERSPRRSGDPAEVAIIVKRQAGCFVVYSLDGGP